VPHIANYDDFDPLVENANVRFITSCREMGEPDLIILPGTKGTIPDMEFLHRSGLSRLVQDKLRSGIPVIGICGGFQMLGRVINDPHHTESSTEQAAGLALLDMETTFKKSKVTRQVKGTIAAGRGLLQGMQGLQVNGFEIHMGRSRVTGDALINIEVHPGRWPAYPDGCVNGAGLVFGTYLHGIFHNREFTRRLLENVASLRRKQPGAFLASDKEKAYDELAAVFRANLDMRRVYSIIFGGEHG
jgi:adenosylcobyric acid synthase